jgi:DhnA family fructose-bisphosphate aldolase class Ia
MSEQASFSKRRMYKIFGADRRALIVAMDHGAGMDVYPDLACPEQPIKRVVEGGADALLATFGIAGKYAQQIGNRGIILRADGGNSELGNYQEPALLYSVEDALLLGADAVACMAFPGSPFEKATLANVSRLASECARWAMPLMVEVIPGGFANPELHTVRNFRIACRIAAELGADFIKTKYIGGEGFREVVEGCYCPIVVLGGERTVTDREFLTMIQNAMEGGAAGVAVGRNIWQRSNACALVSSISAMIHDGARVDQLPAVSED